MLHLAYTYYRFNDVYDGRRSNLSGTSQSASTPSETSQSAGRRAGGQSADNTALVLAELRGLKSTFSASLENLTTRVDKLSETVYGPSAFKTQTEFGARSWAGVSWPPPHINQPGWEVSDDEEEDQPGSGIVMHSEPDKCLIQGAFSATIPNMERPSIRNAFPVTATIPQTKCPCLDPVFRSSLKGTEGVRVLDKELFKAQSLIHDPVGPLTHFLARADEEDFSIDKAKAIVRDSLKLIGNVSATISKMQ